MPKLKQTISATTTVEVTTTVNLSVKARQMLKERAEEHARLGGEVATRKTRMKAIEGEVDTLFCKEKQGKALLDGTKVDGIGFKQVVGSTKKFDKLGFMKKFGVTEADFEEFTESEDNSPYVKITVPKVVKEPA